MKMNRVVCLVILAAAVRIVSAQQPTPTSSSAQSSIEGIVVVRGTNEPIAGADLELSRVDGTAAAPLGPGVAEAFAAILYSTSLGLPAQGSSPPPLLAPEVKYGKTGSDGRFAFKDLKEGKYRLVAVRGGGTYYPVEFGQRDLNQRGLNFPVAAGQALKDVKLEMTPTGAITGRVFDEDGQPMGHAVVMALTAQFQSGEQRAYIERLAMTDESGAFRLYWLGPGKYYVAAVFEDPQRRTIDMAPTAPPGRTIARHRATAPVVTHQTLADGSVIEEAYGVVYYGGSIDSRGAAMVEVLAGQTFPGVDIPLGIGKTRTHHIRGTVINGDTGQPAASAQILAIPRQPSPNALVLTGTTNANGVFDLAGAFPVGYVLTAAVFVATGGTVPVNGGVNVNGYIMEGDVPVDMGNSDSDNVRIVSTSGITVPGLVVIEGKALGEAVADPGKMSIRLRRDPDLIAMLSPLMQTPPPPAGTPRPTQLPPGNGEVTPSGNFKLLLAPGDFRMNIDGMPANTYVKSILMGGEDILRSGLHVTRTPDNPLQITLGTDGGSISGSVVDEMLAPFSNAIIALVPDSPDLRGKPEFYRNGTSDAAGNFQMTAIPPGDYKLFAWEWVPPESWENAEFIRAYENSGKTIRVVPSGKQDRVQLNVMLKAKAAR